GGKLKATQAQGLIRADNPEAGAVDAALRDLAAEAGAAPRSRSITAAETSLPAVDRPVENSVEEPAERSGVDLLTPLGVAALGFQVMVSGLTGGVPPWRVRSATLRRLAGLSHQGLRDVAALKVKGYTDEEIARLLRCTRRSVQRKLALIRREWGGAAF